MANRSTPFLSWLISLINPPPLQTMTRLQKVARVLIFTVSVVVICILCSMLSAALIFALQHARQALTGFTALLQDILIIFISMLVNAICVLVLLKIKHTDQKLIPPEEAHKAVKPE